MDVFKVNVHQGDQDGVKGVYHINAVDCVTQYEGVANPALGTHQQLNHPRSA